MTIVVCRFAHRIVAKWRESYPFHVFPKEEASRKQWIHTVKQDAGKHFQISRNTCVRAEHFTEEHYFEKERKRGARLKRVAVPSLLSFRRLLLYRTDQLF